MTASPRSYPTSTVIDDETWAELSPHEARWKERQQFLQDHGYMLRPRYHPEWSPSWRGTTRHPLEFEDAILLPSREHLIDAVRASDGATVYLKRVKTGDNESTIATMLSSESLRSDTRNHAVPILDVIQDSVDPDISYMVMPFLRLMDSPPFEIVHELVDFADQVLEGMVFLHEHGVAHRDCSRKNLMMDAREMYPEGFHPVRENRRPDATGRARYLPRSEVSVKYYFVDFGISIFIPPDNQPKTALGNFGRDQEVPELSNDVPYDPFKVDVFIIGNVFKHEFLDKFANVDFLRPLIQSMTQRDPSLRPDACETLRQWQTIRMSLSDLSQQWRLRPRQEYWVKKVVYNSFAIYRISQYLSRALIGWITHLQG